MFFKQELKMQHQHQCFRTTEFYLTSDLKGRQTDLLEEESREPHLTVKFRRLAGMSAEQEEALRIQLSQPKD